MGCIVEYLVSGGNKMQIDKCFIEQSVEATWLKHADV